MLSLPALCPPSAAVPAQVIKFFKAVIKRGMLQVCGIGHSLGIPANSEQDVPRLPTPFLTPGPHAFSHGFSHALPRLLTRLQYKIKKGFFKHFRQAKARRLPSELPLQLSCHFLLLVTTDD